MIISTNAYWRLISNWPLCFVAYFFLLDKVYYTPTVTYVIRAYKNNIKIANLKSSGIVNPIPKCSIANILKQNKQHNSIIRSIRKHLLE